MGLGRIAKNYTLVLYRKIKSSDRSFSLVLSQVIL